METVSLGLRLLGYLKKFWYVVPMLAMAALLAIQTHRIGSRDETIRQDLVHATQLEDRNGVTEASLTAANVKIDGLNGEALTRANAYKANLLAAQKSEAALALKEQRTSATVARLEASARDNSKDPCRVSDDAQAALKDL